MRMAIVLSREFWDRGGDETMRRNNNNNNNKYIHQTTVGRGRWGH